MAKRKSRHHRRSRRVSGVGSNSAITMVLGAVAGAIGGEKLATMLPTTIADNIKGGAMLALPILFGKKLKGPLVQGLAIGVAVAGGRMLAKSFGVVSGMPVVNGSRRIRGPYSYPVVSGSGDQPYLRTGAAGNPKQSVINGISLEQYAGSMKSDYADTDRY